LRHSRAATTDTNLQKAGLLIVFVTIFAVLYFGQDVFIPLALAILLTFVLTPVANWLERRHLPRVAAAVLVVLVVCALTVSLSYVVGDQIVQFGQDLKKYEREISTKINAVRGTSSGFFGKAAETIDEIQRATTEGSEEGASASTQSTTGPAANSTQVAGNTVGNVGRAMKGESPREKPPVPGSTPSAPVYVRSADTGQFGQFIGWFGLVLGPLGTIGLVLVLLLFMLLEREDLRDRFIRLSSGGRYIVTTQALNDATERISRFLRAQLIVNGTYGVAVAIGLWLIGLTFGNGVTFPSFILWGVLCAVLRFIPYVGPWMAAAFPVAVSIAVYEGFGVFAATLTMFIVIELISNNFMEPILYGSSTGISTVALLVAAMIWTSLWGAYGLFLSTPLTVCLVVLGRHVPSLSFLDVLLGDRPALPAADRFYQRLLAGDGPDAGVVAHEYAEHHGTIAAADEVVIPAIRMARQDRRADDLTADDEITLYRTAEEILARALETAKDAAAKKIEANDGEHSIDRPLLIGLPAHHRAETIAISLVAGLMEQIGARVDPMSCSLLPSDVEASVEAARPAAVFIAVVPPGGVTQARYLCRRLRRKFKDLPIVVGYFGTFRNFDALLVRFRASGATHVTTSVGQARLQLATLLSLKIDPEVERVQSGPPDDPNPHTAPPESRLGNVPLCTTATTGAEVR
jgi:predicted PurR-regulated permease PerM